MHHRPGGCEAAKLSRLVRVPQHDLARLSPDWEFCAAAARPCGRQFDRRCSFGAGGGKVRCMTEERLRIDAEPTKEFFISMLVKDIELIPAIADLVDNSVDGARRLQGDGPYDDLWVRLFASPQRFRISDNCGGIPVDIAREYAFRFGRAPGTPETPHSVGQFGVGMKRTVFKLGSLFRVTSTTPSSKFSLEVDVDAWKQSDEWNFTFQTLEEDVAQAEADVGTTVEVEHLHPAVAEDFGLDDFHQRLRQDLARKHQVSMDRGLSVSLDAIPLRVNIAELLRSETLQPVHAHHDFGDGRSRVSVEIYAGVAPSKPQDAGWFVYCNGRLVLGPDQSTVTGWGWGVDGICIPRFHGQFAAFRGYVFFDSDDTARLPWNTTKTGVDLDSAVYRAIRRQMVQVMRPIIDFLNRLDAEGPRSAEPDTLAAAVRDAQPTKLIAIPISEVFRAPQLLVAQSLHQRAGFNTSSR